MLKKQNVLILFFIIKYCMFRYPYNKYSGGHDILVKIMHQKMLVVAGHFGTDRVRRVAVVTLTLVVSVLSVTMYMQLRLTRSVPLHTQMMRPSRSASLFPAASRDARIFGSLGTKHAMRANISSCRNLQ